jgi:hypothetical protein
MRWRVLSTLAMLAPSFALAQFHDQGMVNRPAVKTEYVDPKTGTNALPLITGTCLWGNCRTERLIFDRSNHWQQNLPCDPCTGPHQPDSYWAVLFNNEPRADSHNSGPPDVSLPRAVPSQGLMGFETLRGGDTLPGDTRWRAHLVLDFIAFENPVTGGIPFLGFGEFSARGNRNRPLGYLRPSSPVHPSVLSFGARLWDAVPPTPIPGGTQPATLASYLWVLANWGTKPKAIFITLYHFNIQNSVPPGDPAIYHFNWAIAQSALYPGAEIVYIDAEDAAYYCGFELPLLALQQDVSYRIDLSALFACVSKRNLFTEPMPASADIPVTQVLWANESTGIDGDLWIDVHDQRMVPAGTVSTAANATHAPAAVASAKDLTVREIRDTLARQCAATAGCRERAAILAAGRQQTLELPIGQQPSRPALLRTIEPPVTTGEPQQR